MSAKITYFVHDLADPAVQRRVQMLAAGGALVTPIGFRRGTRPVKAIENVPAVEIGLSTDGMLLKRALSVATAVVALRVTERHVRDSRVIIARNLEMLIIAARARKRYAPAARLVYECLDLHHLLLSGRISGAILRSVESRLWREVDLLLTSSPAFVHNYFAPRGFSAPIRIVENKLLMLENSCLRTSPPKLRAGPPWRIGWFGAIRCRKSLDILSSLASAAGGAVEIVIRGRPSVVSFQDFDATIANRPHIRYAGPYRYPADLAGIYGEVHFAWAVDYYEEGQNSAWLLPNRLYEASAHGAVPIAIADVETGAWLTKHSIGVVLKEPLQEELIDFFRGLNQNGYETLRRAMDTLPRADLISNREDCRELVEILYAPSIGNAEVPLHHTSDRDAFRPRSSGVQP
jgi:succinoglycan biosynthesis protein ExoL